MQRNSVTRCPRPGCVRIVRIRGLCQPCYQHLQKRVLKGLLTWEEAEKQGLCLAAQPSGGWMKGWRVGSKAGR